MSTIIPLSTSLTADVISDPVCILRKAGYFCRRGEGRKIIPDLEVANIDSSCLESRHRGNTTFKMAHMTNPLATPEQLYRRNSFSSLPQELRDVVFFATQCLTQAAGLLLQLPQSVTAQANVIIGRYWLVDSMMSNEFSVSSCSLDRLYSFLGNDR